MLNLGGDKFVLGSRRTRRSADMRLRLTSMIDMFTILLVFLLKSYSAEGQIITVTDDLRLPDSTAEKPPASSPVVIVTDRMILLDGEAVASIAEVERLQKTLTIRNLRNGLAEKKEISEALGRENEALGFKGIVTIQGDREIPFRILKKIMVTCGQAGYSNILLAVNQKE
ncbi:MAG TPA: biopolymer transporter ExbD [Bacteroidetes bacterium]|nr:biopolymer transporter ExbD [Bacteroidota bacterium]